MSSGSTSNNGSALPPWRKDHGIKCRGGSSKSRFGRGGWGWGTGQQRILQPWHPREDMGTPMTPPPAPVIPPWSSPRGSASASTWNSSCTSSSRILSCLCTFFGKCWALLFLPMTNDGRRNSDSSGGVNCIQYVATHIMYYGCNLCKDGWEQCTGYNSVVVTDSEGG